MTRDPAARNIARLDLRERRRSLIFYPLGLAVYTLIIVALYPSFKDDSALASLSEDNSAMMALFGASGSLTSPAGWVNANLYTNFVPLIILLVTIGYGASALAGQNENGVLGLVATLPVSRAKLLLAKFVTLIAIAVPVSLTTMICVVIGRTFELPIGIGPLVTVSVAVVLLGAIFGALALAIGAATGSRGTALGVTSAVATLCYLISSLAPAVSWVHQIRFISPFWWATGAGQLATGVGLGDFLALIGATTVLVALAIAATRRMDIR